jgi:C-terminal processing protease CtpA/Prc
MGRPCSLPLAVLVLLVTVRPTPAQAPTSEQTSRAHTMLAQVRDDLRKNYYDSTFGGVDLDSRFRHVDSTLDRAGTASELFGDIAQFMFDLHDSHTEFLPPGRAANVDYGWTWTVIGDKCFVRWVRKDSDAERKGVEVGDEILSIDGIALGRQSRWLVGYVYNWLSPRPGMHLQLRKPGGSVISLDALAKVTPATRVYDFTDALVRQQIYSQMEQEDTARLHSWRAFGDTALVWHFSQFVYADQAIDDMMDRARASKALILDLRDNPGGAVVTILRLLGHFVDHPERVALVRHRNKTDTMTVRPVGRTPFRGNLIVLVNAGSASASEVTARFLQLDGLSTTVGDRSAGAVMTSQEFVHVVGGEKYMVYGATIAVRDMIFDDGNRLENVGVVPEFIILPTGADLIAKRDPQMTKALALTGIQMDAVQAARVYEAH